MKSRMYASKLLTERSPVAKCVMIAEANMDAADSFCAVPDGTGKRYLHFGPSMKSVKRLCREVHGHTHTRNVLLPVETVVERVNRLLKGWGGFYTVGYPSRVFRKVNHYVLKRMARFLNRKSQRYYRLKYADTYYEEMANYGLYRLAWAKTARRRI
ncbi:MAG: hypothetical protein J6N18_04310 [Kiritimatiellae bacterium]|nr:hypothetical protein [Kiritimatiellia bacterium]